MSAQITHFSLTKPASVSPFYSYHSPLTYFEAAKLAQMFAIEKKAIVFFEALNKITTWVSVMEDGKIIRVLKSMYVTDFLDEVKP